MTDQDRLPRLKAQLEKVEASGSPQRFLGPWSLADVKWLILLVEALQENVQAWQSEVERLKDLLRRLEWAGNIQMETSVPICPACRADAGWGHEPDCWLAAALT